MNLDRVLPHVRRPSRYLGNEMHIIRKDWEDCDVRIVFSFPDLYEIGMSHLGIPILYHIVNTKPAMLAERVYAPAPDMEQVLREKKEPLFSLESRRPIGDFDVLGITLPHELCYTNILTQLDLARIPLYSRDRDKRHPLVIGGGPCAFHPEPIADFFDAFLLGDGEEAIVEILEVVREGKQCGMDRAEVLRRLSDIEGIYIPSLYSPRHGLDGEFLGVTIQSGRQDHVTRRVLPDLGMSPFPDRPLVSIPKIVHDRLGVEIARGCTRGCRFCQAGFIYRPVRERTAESVFDYALSALGKTGFEEVALLSLSVGDYACKGPLIGALMDRLSREKVSISLPSLRVGTLDQETMRQIRRVKKTGFTLAPEAGSERLRRVINKGITEEELLATARNAFGLGWRLIKLYFMFGLPGERDEDLDEIAALAHKVLGQAPNRRCRVTVSAATFIPKPHTPFQWARQITIDEGIKKIGRLKDLLRRGSFQVRWQDPRQSYLEGILARGDRRLSRVIERAWQKGARLDGWTDYFGIAPWEEAAGELNINLDHYLEPLDPARPLSWDHLDVGVEKSYFVQELRKAAAGELTSDCRTDGCGKCGLCDFDTVRPVVHSTCGIKVEAGPENPPEAAGKGAKESPRQTLFQYRFQYSRTGEARFLGHLELIQVLYRTLRRARLPLLFSQGHNPTPRVSFTNALPVGTESMSEHFVVDLWEPLKNVEPLRTLINNSLPAGLHVTGIFAALPLEEKPSLVEYKIMLPCPVPREGIRIFQQTSTWQTRIEKKGKASLVDIRPFVRDIEITGAREFFLALAQEPGKQGIKPIEVVAAVSGMKEKDLLEVRIVKWWEAVPETNNASRESRERCHVAG